MISNPQSVRIPMLDKSKNADSNSEEYVRRQVDADWSSRTFSDGPPRHLPVEVEA